MIGVIGFMLPINVINLWLLAERVVLNISWRTLFERLVE